MDSFDIRQLRIEIEALDMAIIILHRISGSMPDDEITTELRKIADRLNDERREKRQKLYEQ